MSRKGSVVLASRTLATLLIVWALTEVSHLPGTVHSFLNYLNNEQASSPGVQYLRHSYLISLGFLLTRFIGYSLMALRLYKCGPEVEELLLPSVTDENATA
jgi:hypothetical protein